MDVVDDDVAGDTSPTRDRLGSARRRRVGASNRLGCSKRFISGGRGDSHISRTATRDTNLMKHLYPVETRALQEAAVALLDTLYRDCRLPPTAAMSQVLNGYYPSLDSLLHTIEHYSDEALVVEFVKKHRDSLDEARRVIETLEHAERAEGAASRTEQERVEAEAQERTQWDFLANRPDAWALVKSASLAEIEAAIAGSLSELCNAALRARVLHAGLHKSGSGTVEIRLELISDHWATLRRREGEDDVEQASTDP